MVRGSFDLADLAAGGVEGGHRRVRDGPLAVDVEAAAVELRALVLHVGPLARASGQLFPQAGGLVGLDRRAADAA